MDIIFTKHALEKFDILKRYNVSVSRKHVECILQNPNGIDRSRLPLLIAQGSFDDTHVLRIVYRKEENMIIVITFYPGRISQYGKNEAN